jgi:hypothetical protein
MLGSHRQDILSGLGSGTVWESACAAYSSIVDIFGERGNVNRPGFANSIIYGSGPGMVTLRIAPLPPLPESSAMSSERPR